AGNIFRAFPAAVQQTLLDQGACETGIIVAEGFDYEIIDKAYRPFDDLSVLVVLKADGTIRKKVIGSVVESLVADPSSPDWERLAQVFASASLKMASFTITEKGYSLANAQGAFVPDVEFDLATGPAAPRSIMGKLASLCLERYRKGAAPIALVSMDNCSHNGTRLYDAVRTFAKGWVGAGLADEGFLGYVENPASVSFPWSMIDKITPRPDDTVRARLADAGYESADIIVTAKKTYTSSFVNAEEKEYLVIEDLFPNGRPPLDAAGIIFAKRETVDRVEKMKVCTCLNPLHTSLAIYGCLLGYTTIHDEMHDGELVALVENIGYKEGLPVVVDPLIMNPKDFLDDVVKVRFPNPFMPDSPQRIATDTSQKLAIRFGETVKAYMSRPGSSARDLKFIPLVFAGWCRYLMGIDDEGKAFDPSPDPLLESSRKHVASVRLGDAGPFHRELASLLSDAKIFGVDLYAAGLGELVEGYFAELVAGKGAVRATLKKHLGQSGTAIPG
ncbi:MAG: mannitol dehydrogenase family protein, partial [Spirochaetaceae bacterium]|nr:mannitol dehydrogenase family protein [Spirochaetaceae bacterium]